MADSRTQFVGAWSKNAQYFNMLRLMASLSKLHSENAIPYLDYRVTENLFCKYFSAENLARSCTAYDARIGSLGIGIKTFGIPSGASAEKIAEFDKLKPQLDPLHKLDLARKIAEFRNDRIESANSIYGITNGIYHIVGRIGGKLRLFNTPYEKIDIDSICNVQETEKSLSFQDAKGSYTFNRSKSVLLKRFVLPDEYYDIDVNILADPLETLSSLLSPQNPNSPVSSQQMQHYHQVALFQPRVKGVDYVVLPLYSTRGKKAVVPEKSGLNQWNAGGRRRDENEVYIPVPRYVSANYPHFFPGHEVSFVLILPTGEELSAKICQAGDKALMSNPNSALGKWILRTVLKKKPGELVTMDDLERFGIDSVLIEKMHVKDSFGQEKYKITFTTSDYESYEDFMG